VFSLVKTISVILLLDLAKDGKHFVKVITDGPTLAWLGVLEYFYHYRKNAPCLAFIIQNLKLET
jgi:hypothetical protein